MLNINNSSDCGLGNTDKKINVSILTLGCKVNQVESEAMMELFEEDGFVIIPPSEKSDIFVINTCAVTKESERKSRQLINKSKRMNPNSLVVAVGCSVQLHSKKISEETQVDMVIGTKNKGSVLKLVKDKMNSIKSENSIEAFKPKESFENLSISRVHDKTRANIKIQDGCSQFCSYCIIPYVRGPIRSRDKNEIVNEVKLLASNGYKEIVVNGIHISSYGRDLGIENALIDLVEELNNIESIERIRFGSLEPNIITEEFMSRLTKLDKVCDHFHLSMQSGSDTVLDRMNRKYTSEQYNNKVDIIRKYMPESGITTDVIVGFPGETEEEFQETFDFIEKIKFSRIHVFKYSVREGTKAASFDNQIDEKTKSERSKRLISLGEDLAHEFMKEFIGKEVKILVEAEKNENYYEGYTTNYLKVLLKDDINIKNEIISTTIKGIDGEFLIGEIQ